ncbi:unnamed protein product [Peronospora belbahrii]|uniref:Uncharacterized protein n=1 Tax=Peronospora belbahrii TaxID=622444 RepID=A0ABN8CR95_9STRA|nr:unnamed protein product [Peronospora belbahrii]
MYSKILILVGILAAGIASADVPLSVEHDVTYALAESVGISSTRSLRAMTEQTAMSVTASSVCDTMSEKSGGLLDLLVLLDLTLIGATDAKDFQACCNAFFIGPNGKPSQLAGCFEHTVST